MKLTARDKYLRTKFEITEEEFDEAFVGQGSVCKACLRPPVSRNLHVDHDHEVENWKIETKKFTKGRWKAWPKDGTGRLEFSREGRTKPQAMAAVRKVLRRLSVRGILCWRCNSGLKKYNDNAESMYRASKYLYDYINFMTKLTDERNGFKE